MDADYGSQYRMLYARHWWWRAREALLLDTLSRHRPGRDWSRILDVGCGDGLFFDRLLAFGDVEGVEPTAALIDPDGPHRHRIHVCPFDSAFRPDHAYGLILMLDVLEHLDDPRAALAHAVSLLAPNGMILVTVPAFPLLWTTHDDLNHHRTRFTRRTFRRLARAADLRIEDERYWFHWLFPVKLATRGAERLMKPTPGSPVVPPRWINALLCAGSRLEQRLLGSLRLPVGSSLMVLGTRRRPSAPATSAGGGAG